MIRIELLEQIRGYLLSQFLDVVSGGLRIQMRFVDEFERPSSYMEKSIFPPQLFPAFNDAAESDMCKRAPDVREHFDDLHASSLGRRRHCDGHDAPGTAGQCWASISAFRECSKMGPLDSERDALRAMCPERERSSASNPLWG